MITSSSPQHYKFPSTLDSLAKVEQIVETLKEEHNIPEEIYVNILVSISEGMNNAINHRNIMNETSLVDFSFEPTDKEFQFIIADHGPGFDFNNVPDPTHPDNIEKLSGRGIFIMESLSD